MADMRKKILEVKNVNKTYQAKNGEIEALKNINFDVKQGEYISIIGPSGCGKSTLLSIIAGLEEKTTGEIYITVTQASEKMKTHRSDINKCCRKIHKTAGKLADGTKLEWEYID